jgi:hypothetical protein
MKKLILMVVALMSFVAVSAQSEIVANFNKGNEEFKAKNFTTAIEIFEDVALLGITLAGTTRHGIILQVVLYLLAASSIALDE